MQSAIVEAVRDGSTLRVRLLMPEGEHQFVNIALAGVKSARAASKQGEPSEPWGEEVGILAYPVLFPLLNVLSIDSVMLLIYYRLNSLRNRGSCNAP